MVDLLVILIVRCGKYTELTKRIFTISLLVKGRDYRFKNQAVEFNRNLSQGKAIQVVVVKREILEFATMNRYYWYEWASQQAIQLQKIPVRTPEA